MNSFLYGSDKCKSDRVVLDVYIDEMDIFIMNLLVCCKLLQNYK